MSRQKKLGVFIATIIIVIVVAMFLMFKNDPANAYVNDIPTPEQMITCQEGDACVLEGRTCDGCCNYVGINSKFKEEYLTHAQKICKSYKGPVCECRSEIRSAKCIKGRCQLSTEIPIE